MGGWPQQPLLHLLWVAGPSSLSSAGWEWLTPAASATRGNREACSVHTRLPICMGFHCTDSTARLSRQRSARPATRVRFWNPADSLLTLILVPSASRFERSRLLKPQRIRIVGLEGVAGPERSPLIHHQVLIHLGSSTLPAHQGATFWEKLRHGALCKTRLVSLPRLPPSRKTSVFCSWLGTSCAWSLRPWGTTVLGVLCVPVQLSHEAHMKLF